VRNQVANLRLEVETMRMLSYRVGWMQTKGEIPVMEASMTKFWADELTQRVYRFISRSLGDYGNLLPGNRIRLPMNGYVNSNAFNTTGISIAGGTTEIQKNIIAQRGLGLPR
jgi:alkylation response protein AidB-like acyl-CoA dehydrogenase